MLTHYIRRSKKVGLGSKVESPIESLLLEACPFDHLVLKPDLITRFYAILARDKEKPPHNSQVVDNLLAGLVQKRFIIEVNGVRIEKLIDTL